MSRISLITALVVAVLAAALTIFVFSEQSSSDASAVSGEQALATFSAFQESGDPELLDQAEDEAERALAADGEDILAAEAVTRVALSRHEFSEALGLAERAAELAPDRFAPVGLRADALIELGRYDEAFPVVDERLQARPDLASYARGSYAAELRGETELAREFMDLAEETSPAGSVGRTFAQIHLIGLGLRYGDFAAAERVIAQAMAENPGLDAEWAINQGRLEAARGDLEAAVATYRAAIEDIPDADHLAELAEIEAALGNADAAEGYLSRARVALEELQSVEDNVLERALLDADWGRVDDELIAETRAGRERRPSVLGDSALAWVLARAGQCAEAVPFARMSLDIGYRDPLYIFRAAYAESCAGNDARAQELAASLLEATPNFSPRWTPAAREMAAGRTPDLPGAPGA